MATDTAGKKRKRPLEKVDSSNRKKPTTSSDRGPNEHVAVRVLPTDKEWIPAIVSTGGIVLDDSFRFQAFHKQTANSSSAEQQLLLHSSQHATVDYTARSDDSFYKHYLGVYDPKQGHVSLIAAQHLTLDSDVRYEDVERIRAGPLDTPSKAVHLSRREQRNELGLAFGTKKAKKYINSLTENAITPLQSQNRDLSPESARKALAKDATAMAVLNEMKASAVDAPTKESRQAAIDEARPRPTHNPDATTKEDIYPLSTIIGNDMLSALKVKPWVEAIEVGQVVETNSRYVSNRLHFLASQERIPHLKALKYIMLLLDFHRQLGGQKSGIKNFATRLPPRDKLVRNLNVPDTLIGVLIKRFTDGGEVTRWHTDLLLTTIAAVTLIVDDFSTDTNDIRQDLGWSNAQVTQYYRETGSRITAMSEDQRLRHNLSKTEAITHRIAQLKVPPEFPQQRVLSARGGKRR